MDSANIDGHLHALDSDIFRRQYIDIEKVPFPQTVAVFEIMKPIAVDYEQPSRVKRIFYSYGMIFYKPIWPTIPETKTRDFVLSVIFVRTMGIDTPSYGWGGNLFGSFGSYRMASLTGVSNGNIFKTLIAVMVIVPIVTLLEAITIGYGFSTRVWFQNRGYGDGIISHLASAWYYNEQPAARSLTEPLVIGFVIAGVLSILHAMFV